MVYAPYDEDYGYVTLQAFLAGKPVITTTDAGGVLEWVEDGVTGLVTDGDARGDRRGGRPPGGDPDLAARLGAAGRARAAALDWKTVVGDAAAGGRVTRPLLAVKAAGAVTASAPLRALLRALADGVEVRALLRCRRRPDAVLGDRPHRRRCVLPGGMPAALWVGAEEMPDLPGRVVAVGHRPGPGGVAVPEHPVDAARWPPIGPAVRRRWRQHLDLPDEWVVRAASVPPEDRPTALALCASAVVYADLPLALALGTPVVTGAEPAAAIGAGDEVLVPGPGEDLGRGGRRAGRRRGAGGAALAAGPGPGGARPRHRPARRPAAPAARSGPCGDGARRPRRAAPRRARLPARRPHRRAGGRRGQRPGGRGVDT